MKQTVRLNFDFPREEYPYLKLLCAKRGVTLKTFATDLLTKAIEDAEDEMLAKEARERLENLKEEDLISWDEAVKKAGWNV